MKLPNKISNIIEILLHVLPVSKNKILFSSFHGQYNDNPKYISEEFHKRFPQIKLYWVLSEKSKMNDIPDYIEVVRYNTLKYCIVKNRCCAIVENGAGAYLFDNSTGLFELKKKLKNTKQLDFSTWHGNPIKHIGAQIPGNEFWNVDTFFTSSDILIAGCGLVKNIFEQAFLKMMPVELMGTPRNDILFRNDESLNTLLRTKLNLPINKKIVLFAPTYRDTVKSSGIVQMELMDFDRLFHTLNERFGGEWIFVYRVHNMVLLEMNLEEITEVFAGRVICGNDFDDMAEYLVVADALISDYSGCIYDIALTDKPCFLFAHDKERYETEERGLYFPVSKFPYSFAENFEQLLNNIRKYDTDETKIKRTEFLNYIENCEDGRAASRAVDYIYKKCCVK